MSCVVLACENHEKNNAQHKLTFLKFSYLYIPFHLISPRKVFSEEIRTLFTSEKRGGLARGHDTAPGGRQLRFC